MEQCKCLIPLLEFIETWEGQDHYICRECNRPHVEYIDGIGG